MNSTVPVVVLARAMDMFGMPTWSENHAANELVEDGFAVLRTAPSEALKNAEDALAMAPRVCFQALHLKGAALAKLGRTTEALQCFEDGIAIAHALNPAWQSADLLEWGHIGNRPYMRLFYGKLLVLMQAEEHVKALALAQQMLQKNPSDNQGIRALALNAAGNNGDVTALEQIVDMFRDTPDMDILYAKTLLGRLLGVDEQQCHARLAEAMRSNFHVPRSLLQPAAATAAAPEHIIVGGIDQAHEYARHASTMWNPALTWLARCENASVPSETDLVGKLESCGYLFVKFRKRDGSERLMLATRTMHSIPIPARPKSGAVKQHVKGAAIHVFDRDAGDWRSVKFDSLLAVPFFDILTRHALPSPENVRALRGEREIFSNTLSR